VSAPSKTQALVRADAEFEAILGSLLVIGAGASWLTAKELPVSRIAIAAVGAGFLLASASQFVYFVHRPRRILLELAIGNAAMGFAGLLWLILSRGFSTGGIAIVSGSCLWKCAIGILQIRSLGESKRRPGGRASTDQSVGRA
jgi:hypothetical protein